MPINTGLTDQVLVKLVKLGKTDKEIAEMYDITVQAVNKRLVAMGMQRRTKPNQQVNDYLRYRWEIRATQGNDSHHNRYSAKALKVWLRRQLGDETLSMKQRVMADQWERRMRSSNEVLCYDPDRSDGWYYRPRTPEDGRLVIDWPESIPFPDERFRKALELPPEPPAESE
jgi:hypothetical protein